MRKLVTILSVLFLSTFHLFSQTFNVVADLSGLPPSSQEVSDLETVSNLAKAQFPADLHSKFKVYDFGFYSHSRHMQGGNDALWDKVKEDVAAKPESDYYIIFGREASDAGPNSNIRVELELPRTSQFNCLNEEKRNNIEKYVQAVANQNLSASAYQGEIKALEILEAYIYKIIECECNGIRTSCDLSVDYKFIDPELSGLGFRKKEIQIGDACSWISGNQGIYDYFGKQVIIGGQPYCISEQVSEGKSIIEASQQILPDTTISTSITGKVFILDNESFANGEWDNAKAESNSHDYVEYWLVIKDSKTNKHYLYSKFTLGQIETPISVRGSNSTGNRSTVVPTPFSIALNALGNAAIDALIQTVGLRILDPNARKQPTELDRWLKAWEKIDKVAAAWEGISSLIPWKKTGKYSIVWRAATSGIAVVIDHATSGNYPNYSVKDGLIDFAITFGTSSLTQIIAQNFNLSQGPKLISEGLDHWYDNAANGALKKIIFQVSKVYDDFTNGVVQAGKYIEQKVAVSNVRKIDLMGGKKSQLGGDFVNIDLSEGIEKGIKGDATKLGKFLPANSVDEVVCNNPYLGGSNSAEDYIKQLALIMKKDGKVYINGQMQNKYFKNVNSALAQQYGFVIESFQVSLLDKFKNLIFKTTTGSDINKNTMLTTILKKL
jgi:hypothetical protein